MPDTRIEGRHVNLFKYMNVFLEEKEQGNRCIHALNI